MKGAIGASVPTTNSRQPVNSMSDRRFAAAVISQNIVAL